MPIPPPPLDNPKQEQPTQELAPTQRQEVNLWSRERLDLIKRTLVPPDITDTEFALFVEVCKRRGLDPFLRHIYAVKRGGKLTIQTSIDGYRLIAERTGKYLGQSAPEWCGEDGAWKDVWTGKGNPFACRIGVFKDGQQLPTVAVGYWATYASVGPFWQKSGPSQLAKCTEALALRKAFPEELSGIYTNEEMQQSEDEMTSYAGSVRMVNENAPVAAEEHQPLMIFPKEIISQNQSGALIKDTKGLEWIVPVQFSAELTEKLASSGFMLVFFTIETGRRVITGLGTL